MAIFIQRLGRITAGLVAGRRRPRRGRWRRAWSCCWSSAWSSPASLAASPDYQAIYHGVSGKDASAIEAVLREHSIAMHFDDKDGTVSVPSKDESNATMYIEAAGILSKDSDVVGIEAT